MLIPYLRDFYLAFGPHSNHTSSMVNATIVGSSSSSMAFKAPAVAGLKRYLLFTGSDPSDNPLAGALEPLHNHASLQLDSLMGAAIASFRHGVSINTLAVSDMMPENISEAVTLMGVLLLVVLVCAVLALAVTFVSAIVSHVCFRTTRECRTDEESYLLEEKRMPVLADVEAGFLTKKFPVI